MPFFVFLWNNKWLSTAFKPSTFTGNVPLLAEDFTDVVRLNGVREVTKLGNICARPLPCGTLVATRCVTLAP